ncbi:hypothetical protein QCA50_014292 [Cerrena zonata]|uniref:Type 1 phosphatases regulator n=1 Tax=Cerrena zonata TaxID=2478898 RepID=A0AAW0FQZ8_9APHY
MSQVARRGGPSNSAPADGSRTITLRDSQPNEEDDGSRSGEEVGRLHLRGARRRTGPRVVWSEDVVDNEGMGKKSSKICCIYHKPKRFDESSSSDNSSDSDSSCDHSHPHSHGRKKRRHAAKPDSDSSPNNDATRSREGGGSVVHELHSDPDESNMYEKVPRQKKGKGVVRNEA